MLDISATQASAATAMATPLRAAVASSSSREGLRERPESRPRAALSAAAPMRIRLAIAGWPRTERRVAAERRVREERR